MCCEWCGTFQGRIDQVRSLTCMGFIPVANIHVHHINYDRIGMERFSDLAVICSHCHEKLHKFIDRMTKKGFSRRRVMDRLAPYCVRRIMKIQEIYRS